MDAHNFQLLEVGIETNHVRNKVICISWWVDKNNFQQFDDKVKEWEELLE